MDFLGWYTTGEQPTTSDINVHKQVSVQNKQVSDPTFFIANSWYFSARHLYSQITYILLGSFDW